MTDYLLRSLVLWGCWAGGALIVYWLVVDCLRNAEPYRCPDCSDRLRGGECWVRPGFRWLHRMREHS